MRPADQLLFGYRDGHRLLAGSRELPSDTFVQLLGVSDAAPAPGSPPLVTGLALRDSSEFALCVTWSAPEVDRPGAVWAHALIVDAASLADPQAFQVLLGLPRRPAADGPELDRYAAPLPLDQAPALPGYLAPPPLDLQLLELAVLSAYGADGDRLLLHDDLGSAARALLVLWNAQWPGLRASFSFRTRESVRRGPTPFDLTVARKVRGHDDGAAAPAAAPGADWATAIVADAASPRYSQLRDFLWRHGPSEDQNAAALRRLTETWLRSPEGAIWRAPAAH